MILSCVCIIFLFIIYKLICKINKLIHKIENKDLIVINLKKNLQSLEDKNDKLTRSLQLSKNNS